MVYEIFHINISAYISVYISVYYAVYVQCEGFALTLTCSPRSFLLLPFYPPVSSPTTSYWTCVRHPGQRRHSYWRRWRRTARPARRLEKTHLLTHTYTHKYTPLHSSYPPLTHILHTPLTHISYREWSLLTMPSPSEPTCSCTKSPVSAGKWFILYIIMVFMSCYMVLLTPSHPFWQCRSCGDLPRCHY